ncbi:MAG: hypothetical protein AAF571_02425 [Verrucomicrobiota bacterium]
MKYSELPYLLIAVALATFISMAHAELDEIQLGKTGPEDLAEEYEGKGYSMTSEGIQNHQYIDKDYVISVQFDSEGVYGFQAFGGIKLSEIEKFLKKNRDLGFWEKVSEESRVERRVLDEKEFRNGNSFEQGKLREVTIVRMSPDDGETILEYWENPGSSTKAYFAAVYVRDRKIRFADVEGVTHFFQPLKGKALIRNLDQQGTLVAKQGRLYGMKIDRRGDADPNDPEANGFEISTQGQPYPVKYVGYFDFRNDGLAVEHEVFLWDRNENLLFQQTIPAGEAGKLNGSFRWVELNQPWILESDSTYFLTATTHSKSGRYDNPASIQADAVRGSQQFKVSGETSLWTSGKKLSDLKFPTHVGTEWLSIGPNLAQDLNLEDQF